MIFRKPYAFLIKNFRKIHILLLALCLYVFYKQNQVLSFVKEYVSLGTYNAELESIDSKITFLLMFSLIIIISISVIMLWLLYYKKKPWKTYLIFIGEYILMFSSLVMISTFFHGYDINTTITGVFIARDLLSISGYIQYVVFLFLIIRIMGIDLNKFSFNTDQEFLELNSKDKEEFEVSLSIDKHSLLRTFNKLKRNIKYFYIEHKYVCNIALTGLFIITIGYSYYTIFVVHKSYKENETLNTGVYEISILNSYVTNKDLAGNKIEKGSKFVIIDMVMKNSTQERIEPNLERFHLMNKNKDITYTLYYNEYFTDLGTPTTAKMNINANKSKNFYMVFRVDEELKNNNFVLYYQELGGKSNSYLRKIKLKLQDISNIESKKNYKLGEKLKFSYIAGTNKSITLEKSEILDTASYKRYVCDVDRCNINTENLISEQGYKILKISFSSSDFEGVDFVDFSNKYGKIEYENSKGEKKREDIVDKVGVKYEGKEAFFKIKEEIANSKSINLIYTLRNKKYIVKIK